VKKPTIIVSDLDGTLTNTMDEVCAIMWDRLRVALCEKDVAQYDVAASFWQNHGVRYFFQHLEALTEFLELNIWSNPDVYARVKPYFNWHQELQHAIRSTDVEVILLTSRPPVPRITQATELWCSLWGYDDCKLLFAKAYERGKLEALQEILAASHEEAFIWFVDDDPALCDHVRQNLPPDKVWVASPVRPWTGSALNFLNNLSPMSLL
jgi:hypothetical protein